MDPSQSGNKAAVKNYSRMVVGRPVHIVGRRQSIEPAESELTAHQGLSADGRRSKFGAVFAERRAQHKPAVPG